MLKRSCNVMTFCICLGLLLAMASPSVADQKDGRLDIYFIDVEGGAATLFVTPAGESLLVDSGYPDNNGRDRDRILKVATKTCGLKQIDHAAVTHWHIDHYGNHAALASLIRIGQFWDRGIPDVLSEDSDFADHIANYRRASQNKSKTLRVGDTLPLKSANTPLSLKVVTASRQVIESVGPPNSYSKQHVAQDVDNSDNAASLSFELRFGSFKFLCCGDLTWNQEALLVTPNNPLGLIDLFMVTHHGLETSNNPVLVLAIDPKVAVMCNGPTKGGHPNTLKTLRKVKSLEALYQLHKNVAVPAEDQAPAEYIANEEPTADCKGTWVKASVAPDGKSFTVQIGPEGTPRRFEARS